MKRNVWRRLAATMAAGIVCLVPTVIHTQPQATPSAQPAEQVSEREIAVVPPVCDSIIEAPARDYQAEERAAVSYMRSPGRIAMFEADFRQASVLVAKGLDAGKFAPVTKRYDDWKNDRKPGYSGWGGISTLNNSHYAWVWWNHDGSIDYTTMGVTGFSVTGGGTSLQIEMLDSGDGPYKVFLDEGIGSTRVSNTYFALNSKEGPFRYPSDLTELIQLDQDALAALNYTMTLNFGVNWRQLR